MAVATKKPRQMTIHEREAAQAETAAKKARAKLQKAYAALDAKILAAVERKPGTNLDVICGGAVATMADKLSSNDVKHPPGKIVTERLRSLRARGYVRYERKGAQRGWYRSVASPATAAVPVTP